MQRAVWLYPAISLQKEGKCRPLSLQTEGPHAKWQKRPVPWVQKTEEGPAGTQHKARKTAQN
jgi:hypothetical protein